MVIDPPSGAARVRATIRAAVDPPYSAFGPSAASRRRNSA